MRNLKRALSLALAAVMVLGLMIVGAGAADVYDDFTDKDEIQHTEAVQTLVTLNVIEGKEDGSFYDPTGTLTRAEMAKLIAYALNGGEEPVLSIKPTPTYSDIDNHWAESYIEYCTSMNIIAGDGAGKFNPEGTLTGSQAAKMMLVAMNYGSDVFGLTGTNWEINTNREANAAGLYDDLGGLDPSEPISRDDAAQLVYNGILANTMRLSWNQNVSTGEVTQTYTQDGDPIFVTYFDGTIYGGVLQASGEYDPYSVGGSQNNFVVDVDKVNDETYAPEGGNTIETFTRRDFDITPLVGEYVKVLAGQNNEVYGVYSSDEENGTILRITTDAVDEIGSNYIEVDDTRYSTDSNMQTLGGTINTNEADNLKLVDNDDDGDIDVALVVPVGVGQVAFLGSDSLTIEKKGGSANLEASNQDLDDVIAYEGIEADDYVVFTKDLYTDKDLLTEATVSEGTITGLGSNSNGPRYLIDGTWYQAVSSVGSSSIYNNPASGDSVTYVALGTKLYYMEKTSGANSVDDVAMLITASTANTVDGVQARLLFADGSKQVVTVASGYTAGVIPANVGKLFSFAVNNDGEYELTLASTTAWNGGADMGDYTFVAGNTNDLGTAGTDISTVGTYTIADDAVVFVSAIASRDGSNVPEFNAANNGQIMTGRELKALTTGNSTSTIAATSKGFFTSTTNGLTRASIVAVTLGTTGSSFEDLTGASYDNYGYLVSDAYYTTEDGTNYIVFQLWNGTDTVTVRWARSNASSEYSSYKKHDVIAYDETGDGLIANVTEPASGANTTGVRKGAVTGLDGDDLVIDSGSTVYKLNSDTNYLYVNSSASSSGSIGVESGRVRLADKPAGTSAGATPVYVQNMKYIANLENGEWVVELIVVDVNNRLADRDSTSVTMSSWNGISSISVNGSRQTSGNLTLAAGDTVSVTADAGYTVTVKGLIPSSAAPGGVAADTTVNAGTTVSFVVGNSTAGVSITAASNPST